MRGGGLIKGSATPVLCNPFPCTHQHDKRVPVLRPMNGSVIAIFAKRSRFASDRRELTERFSVPYNQAVHAEGDKKRAATIGDEGEAVGLSGEVEPICAWARPRHRDRRKRGCSLKLSSRVTRDRQTRRQMFARSRRAVAQPYDGFGVRPSFGQRQPVADMGVCRAGPPAASTR